MSDLRLDLDTIVFTDLVALGRSMIPTIAPGWTDHNVHDPGIMLMELASWIADAQVYALSRVSRRERAAYGRLLGLQLTGPQPAAGLIWPLGAGSTAGGAAPWAVGTIVDVTNLASSDRPTAPVFFPTRRIELTTAALTEIATAFADGTTRDWTRANSQQGATYLPFGETPQRGDRLVLTLDGPLIGPPGKGQAPAGAPISIGFEIVSDPPSAFDDEPVNPGQPAGCTCGGIHLAVSLSDAAGPWKVSVDADTTDGLAHSGVLLLTIDPELAGKPGPFTLAIESQTGSFLLPPRVQRIALNVVPVQQLEHVSDVRPQFGTAEPNQEYTLRRSGLQFPTNDSNFKVFLGTASSDMEQWTRIADLTAAEPDAAVYAFDEASETLSFGNGINGRMPSAGADLRVEYVVSAGALGNLPRGLQWEISGVPKPFGPNAEPTSGGRDARDLAALRALARSQVLDEAPIVTTADLQNAALAFTDLDVRRAQELAPGAGASRVRGARVLVAVGPHESTDDTFTESEAWLAEIRRRLTPRVPLGQSLDVIGPRLVAIEVVAQLVAMPRLKPDDVRAAAEQVLREQLTITGAGGRDEWAFGRDVTLLMIKGWLRNVAGVAQVTSVVLQSAQLSAAGDRVVLGPIDLPRIVIKTGDIRVTRATIGGGA